MSGKSSLPRWIFLIDILAGICAIFFVYLMVYIEPSLAVHSSATLTTIDYIFYASFVVLTLTSIALGGDYMISKRYSRLTDISLVLRSVIIAFVLLVSSAFVLEDFIVSEFHEFSRPGILMLSISFALMLLAIRLVAHHTQVRLFSSGSWRRKMVIVGAGPQGVKVYDHLQSKNWLGVKCIGFVDQSASKSPVEGAPLLGRVEDLATVVLDQDVEEIVIALPPEDHILMEKIVNNGVRRDVKVRIIPDSFAYPYSEINIQEYDGLAMIDVKQTNLDAMHSGLKRFMDILLAIIMLIIHSPLWVITVLLIRTTSKGPALYRQTRLGKDGESFEMLKFRSMVEGAHEMRNNLKRNNEASGPIFKMKDDPRVTRTGRLLRRTSLDELPQFLNVLQGDMSIVGPRPPLPEEVGRYQSHHLKRLAVRPGVTGLWQVSGRDRRDFEEMSRLDLYYIENWSIRLDLKIILKTVPTVLRREGAY